MNLLVKREVMIFTVSKFSLSLSSSVAINDDSRLRESFFTCNLWFTLLNTNKKVVFSNDREREGKYPFFPLNNH